MVFWKRGVTVAYVFKYKFGIVDKNWGSVFFSVKLFKIVNVIMTNATNDHIQILQPFVSSITHSKVESYIIYIV